ncbi:hypothetical protein B0T14DRAFT_561527 [Immersiella caudata]|uniref:Uncharacterized protein n=1 Tax=Immersiella caudata TaxID=314043 RepID=A0AA39XHH3_9PEZI|nr:hypothetical protein B0T14DRAFT_561527 [Immersiella caudata]
MAYYESSPDVKGTRVSSVTETASGHTTLWEENVTSGTFGNGNVFTATIGRPVGQGEFSGTAKANQGDFSCWRNHRKGLYIWDIYLCDGIYDCNRKARTATTSDSVRPWTTMSSAGPATGSESSEPPHRTSPEPEERKDGTTRAAEIAGIVAGIAAFLALLGGIFGWWYRRRKDRAGKATDEATDEAAVPKP